MSSDWKPLPTDAGWLVSEDSPPVLVRRAAWSHEPDGTNLGDDPVALHAVLLEALAHDLSDEALGSLVRAVLEDSLDAARRKGWRWTNRVRFVREHEESFF